MYTAQQYHDDYSDGNTKQPVEFRNVIAIEAATRVLDNYGRLSVNLIASGDGYYACGGKLEPITWQRENLEDCFHYFRADGSELTVSEGTTYVCVLSQGQSTFEYE